MVVASVVSLSILLTGAGGAVSVDSILAAAGMGRDPGEATGRTLFAL